MPWKSDKEDLNREIFFLAVGLEEEEKHHSIIQKITIFAFSNRIIGKNDFVNDKVSSKIPISDG